MHIRDRAQMDLDACVEALAQVQAVDRYPVHWPDDPGGWLTPDDLVGAWVAVEPTPEVTGPARAWSTGEATGQGPDEVVGSAVAVLGHVALTRDMEVTRLFVVPAARGRGVAARLLDTVRAAAGAPLRLEVSSEGTDAIRFYERSGWRRIGSTRATWLNAAGEPALLHRYVSPAPRPSEPPRGATSASR
ncbi:GNAT family N-acetyltransferase [Nonomuraea antimicrobica]|uniref:GNAT family N-acetyltransferase n=1 Tax=Nonomuraea antimicrobica TaxID=561173 RepID=A0ABP7CSN4_9ACTN